MKFTWTDEKLVAKGHDFLQAVINNMGPIKTVQVRFGTEGEGTFPNYQVDKVLDLFGQEKRESQLYQSRSHAQLNVHVDKFDDANLSEPYSLERMLGLLALSGANPR